MTGELCNLVFWAGDPLDHRSATEQDENRSFGPGGKETGYKKKQ